MAKSHTRFVCESCGAAQTKWMGRCPACGEWNTMVETIVEASPRSGSRAKASSILTSQAQPLLDVRTDGYQRLRVPMEEFSRVLGGGIVPGAVILIGGDPGIGKSTLLLQLAAMMGKAESPVLYVSGEESLQQTRLRAERLNISTPCLRSSCRSRICGRAWPL